jgi:hypothetical protein
MINIPSTIGVKSNGAARKINLKDKKKKTLFLPETSTFYQINKNDNRRISQAWP